MTHNRKKVAKIIEELTMYFFTLGATRIQSEIEMQERQAVIRFKADYAGEEREGLKKLQEFLNEPKNKGIEDFYWELAGSGDPGETSQLLLVGMMIDKFEINIGESEVSLVLYKELDDDIYI